MAKHVRAHEVEGVRAAPPHTRTLKHLAAPWTIGSRNLWVGLSEVDPGSSSNLHAHDNEEAFFVLSGYGRVQVDAETVAVGPGSLVLVPPNTPHRLFNPATEVLRVLCCAAPAFDKTVFDSRHLLEDETGSGPSSDQGARSGRIDTRPASYSARVAKARVPVPPFAQPGSKCERERERRL